VTLYFNTGHLQANSGSTVELTAPSTGATSNGDVANMLIWGGPNASNMEIDSTSQSYFQGIVYLPDQQLTLNSGSGVTINSGAAYTALDVNNLMVDSGVDFVINGSNGLLGTVTNPPTLGSFAVAE